MLARHDLDAARDALIRAARRCFDLRLQTNAGGNLSVRLSSADAIVIKPSGVGFAECTRDNLQIVSLDGSLETSAFRPSKDLDFHLGIYRVRPDIHAIVHCHSPWATGYASASVELPCLTVQTLEKLGRVPLIPLSENGGPQTDAEISPVFRDPQVCAALLECHGTIGVGETLTDALYVVEIIEETAQIAFVRDTLLATRSDAGFPGYGTDRDAAEAAGRAAASTPVSETSEI